MNAQSDRTQKKRKPWLTLVEIAVYAMLGTLMFCSDIVMEALPNIHLVGMLTMIYTIAFRFKALVPIYGYVILNGLYGGFGLWWIPYLYIWAILWGITMLLPRNMPKKIACVVYPIVCCLHGLAFGVLYAPTQALMFGLNFKQTLAWIAAGFPFDIIHGIGNLVVGLLIVPLSTVLCKLVKKHF